MQLSINFEAARAVGEQAGQACLNKATRTDPLFAQRAATAILNHLRVVRQASGEELTDVAIAHGAIASDSRAFGPVFRKLLSRQIIHVIAYGPRRKGHGCMGAKIYAIVN